MYDQKETTWDKASGYIVYLLLFGPLGIIIGAFIAPFLILGVWGYFIIKFMRKHI